MTQRLLLSTSALAFGIIGLLFLFRPEDAAASIGLAATAAAGRIDLRATYGGLMLGLAGLFAMPLLRPTLEVAGPFLLLFVYGGLAFGRGLAMLLGEPPAGQMVVFLVIELLYVLGALGLVRGSRLRAKGGA